MAKKTKIDWYISFNTLRELSCILIELYVLDYLIPVKNEVPALSRLE